MPDLQKERAKCTFNKEEITNLMDGGEDKTQFRRRLGKYFFFFMSWLCFSGLIYDCLDRFCLSLWSLLVIFLLFLLFCLLILFGIHCHFWC